MSHASSILDQLKLADENDNLPDHLEDRLEELKEEEADDE